jgi:hypothetical protein
VSRSYAQRRTRRKPPPPDGSPSLPGPAPTGVQPHRLHLTPEAVARLDQERDRLRIELADPKLSRSQAAELVLMRLPLPV